MTDIPINSISVDINDLSNKPYTKLMSSIKQKNDLIKSLKFTIDNLTNIIVNNNHNINNINDNINETIKSELNETFIDKYFSKIENYIKTISKLDIENSKLNKQLDEISNESNISIKSYDILNSAYLDYIKNSCSATKVLNEKIHGLLKTVDSIKDTNDVNIKNLRNYYHKELRRVTGVKCSQCSNNGVNTVFIPCNHLVLCENCIKVNKTLSKSGGIKCSKCNIEVESFITIAD